MDIHEDWRVIADATDYAISNFGRVKRIKADWQGKYLGRIIAGSRQRGGYLAYNLRIDGAKVTKKAHRLVCEAFNGPSPSGKHCCAHRDGNPSNNIPDNLYWATYAENAADRERHGKTANGDNSGSRLHPERLATGDRHWTRKNPHLVPKGDSHYARKNPDLVPVGEDRYLSKLKEHEVLEILSTPKTHGSGKALAEKFNVSMGLISAVRNRRVWAYLSTAS